MSDTDVRVAALKAQLSTLEQLLEVHERTAAEQARKSEAAAADLHERNLALLESEREKNEALRRLRSAVEELSTPILEIWDDVLALPVIGVLDSRRMSETMERVLEAIVEKQCRFVIIDITGVEVVDTATANHFVKLVRAIDLLGAKSILTGIRPAVAQTLVSIGVDLGALTTLRNLKHGLEECMRLSAGRAK